MKSDLYLSYSGRKTYLSCPKKYKFIYIDEVEIKKDPSTSFYGSIIGTLFEWFYERNVWKDNDPIKTLRNLIHSATDTVLKKEEYERDEDPTYIKTVEDDVYNDIPGGIETIRFHRLLSPNSQTELNLNVTYKHPDHDLVLRIGGRSDFVHYFDESDVWILDGKGSRHREKFADPEQLIWYAVQHYIKYHIAPTRLGFIFWRFPDNPIQWVDYDESSMRSSLNVTFDVAKKITLKVFNPKTSKECYGCSFVNMCEDGREFVSEMKRSNRITDSIFDLDELI